MVHEIKHKPIQRQQAFGRRNLLGGAGDVALPLAGVDLGEYWVTQHRPSGVEGKGETDLWVHGLVVVCFHSGDKFE